MLLEVKQKNTEMLKKKTDDKKSLRVYKNSPYR